jgi:DNA-binding CsgD family transcriptional regulator
MSRGALSARELEILLLAAYGLSHREIDEILHLAEATRRGLQEDWVTVSGVTEEIG